MSARRLEKRPNKEGQDTGGSANVPKKKRETITTACKTCQKRKSKCDGGKPACSLCVQKSTPCEYPDDSRRTVNLRANNLKLSAQVGSYEKLLETLRQTSSANALLIGQGLAEVAAASAAAAATDSDSKASAPGTSEAKSPTQSHTPNDHFLPLLQNWQITTASDLQDGSTPPWSAASAGSFRASGSLSEDGSIPTAPNNNAISSKDSFGYMASPAASWVSVANQSFKAGRASAATGQVATDAGMQETPQGTVKIWQPGNASETLIPPQFVLPLSFMHDPIGGSFSDQYARVDASFQSQKREELARGDTTQLDFIGLDTVDGGALLSDSHLERSDSLSAFVFRLTRTFLDDRITTLGFMHMRYRMLQWLIYPCQESFGRLPNLMKPIPEQICIPHPCWVDFVPLPGLRRAFILKPELRGRDWLPTIATCRVGWSHTLEETLVRDPLTRRYAPSQAFQQHLENADIWTLARSHLNIFPEFEGQVKLREA